MINWLLCHSKRFEVLIRRIAFAVPKDANAKMKKVYYKIMGQRKQPERNPESAKHVLDYLDTLGIKKGDILVVHSSADGFKDVGLAPTVLINHLLELVGEEGTLVFPTYPVVNRTEMFGLDNTEPPLYDPKRTLCWTGLLPNVFLKYPGVVRSEFPYNTLAAKGKDAVEMMRGNIDSITPHDVNSAWNYCIQHDAKFLFLGVSLMRSYSILHVVEDMMGDEWPATNWYIEQEYRVKTENGIINKKIKVFNPMWYEYSGSHNEIFRLKRLGYITQNTVDGVPVAFTRSSKQVFDFVRDEALTGKTRYIIPKKYRRKA